MSGGAPFTIVNGPTLPVTLGLDETRTFNVRLTPTPALGWPFSREKLLAMGPGALTDVDTPEALQAYLQSFDPRITALTGTPEQIAKAAQAFDAHYEKVDTGRDYTYDHTIKTFMFDRSGQRAGGVDLNTANIDRRELLAVIRGLLEELDGVEVA